MTSNNGKLRALFLAALMVLSITVGSIAFAGGAAAAVQGDNGGAEVVTVTDGTASQNVTFNVTNGTDIVADGGNVVNISFTETNGISFDGATASATLTNASGNEVSAINAEVVNDYGADDVNAVNITITENSLNASNYEDGDELQVDVTLTGLGVSDAEHGDATYTLTNDAYDVSDLELDFTVADDSAQGTQYLGQYLSAATNNLVAADTELRSVDDGEVGNLEQVLTVFSDQTSVDTSDLAAGQYVITDNASGTEIGSDDVRFELVQQDLDAEWDEESIENEGDDTETFVELSSSLRNDYNVIVSADNLDHEDLTDIFTEDTSSPYASEDDDEIVIEDADGEISADFDGISTGSYSFNFEVVDSTASASASIDVEEEATGELGLDETSVTQQQGDVAYIPVTFQDTETGQLVIGDVSDNNYQANISIDSGGEDLVTVAFNTMEAGNDTIGDAVWIADDDTDAEITDESEIVAGDDDKFADVLDTGDYQLSVKSGESGTNGANTIDQSDNVGTLWIEERSTDSMNVWTASSSNAGDIETIDDVTTAVEDGQLTQTETVAMDDEVVLEISASGLNGFMLDSSFEDGVVTDEFYTALQGAENETFNITFEQAAPGANRDAETLNLADLDKEDLTVFYDESGDNYYVLVNQVDLADSDNADHLSTLEDEEEYEVSFDVQDDWLLQYAADYSGPDTYDGDEDSLEDEYETVTASVTFEDITASFDLTDVEGTDYIVVEAAEEQEITGTTNIAPGSEVTIRASGTGDARFVEEKTELVVAEDGSFAGTFDFSEQSDGDEFEASLRGDLLNDDDGDNFAADGLVQEAQPADTTTEEPADTTTEEPADTTTTTEEPADTTTEAPADTTTEAPTETPTETPGFTMGLALVALLGAALLALRRN
ncbi:BGTF surface domain-containing protein [Halodesulfurarchaeum formicicum]|uniref:PGF-CTERM sorting domain-containing protein n=1 Tax=Halodesulfurarchaeum formicicum TaxID=1873524 RepID=A0A1J1AD24_9EURY|nr:BGTF surface domain-containing protein [Halodesulfurarchaeum formicicum]APE96052.1 hypothetical protein HSR6_1612 [Halodesulfurarchaeum formicicum]